MFEKPLGQGGMAEVWLARNVHLGTPAAIKFLNRAYAGVSEVEQRFVNEGRRQGLLSHPNIIKVYGFEYVEDHGFLILQYVDGESLDELLCRVGRLETAEALRIGISVLNGLDHAHTAQIVHRDIKPSNILVDKQGFPYLGDFGIVLAVDEKRMTRTGTSMGTALYMSPEQIVKPGSVDRRSDIYSFGCVLYEMLAGEPPFNVESTGDGSTDFLIKTAHVQQAPPPLRGHNASVSAAIESVVMRCLAKNPADRYATCRDLRDALSAAMVARPAPPPLPPLPPRPEPVMPKKREPTIIELPTERLPIDPAAGVPKAGVEHPRGGRTAKRLVVLAVIVAGILFGLRFWWTQTHRPHTVSIQDASKGPSTEPAKADPATTGPAAGTSRVNPKDGLTYVWIPPGTFTMGCSPGDTDCRDDEKPAHQVTITKGFWIGQTEVTQAAYQRVTGTNPSHFKGPLLPVDSISWEKARRYCAAAGMRLPTEAEWEYAARGGNASARYGTLDAVAWYGGNSGGKVHEVGQKQANAYGLYDMLGSVGEWAADRWGNYGSSPVNDPQGPSSGQYRPLRGGSWYDDPMLARASGRGESPPGIPSDLTGVRCAED